MDMTFLNPGYVHLLWACAGMVALLAWLGRRGQDRLNGFVSAQLQARLARRLPDGARRLWLGLALAVLAFSVIALMRPQSKSANQVARMEEASAEVMAVLDVSKSMLAEDAPPNRLERAKAELQDLAKELAGDRVGLIAFAGRPSVLCPLTSDRSFFNLVLQGVSETSVTRGGTQIGDAIHKAVEGFSPGQGAKLILLITDGEDHDSRALEAAKEARDRGIRIIAIGFGDEGGSQIIITDPRTGDRQPMRDREGHTVVSKLNGELLRKLALETEGAYVPAGTGVLDLVSIMHEHIQPLIREAGAVRTQAVRAERYQIFIAAAMLALLASAAVTAGLFHPVREEDA